MQKKSAVTKPADDFRNEYNLSELKGGVREKYRLHATAGTNLVLIDSDLMHVFPDADAVNRALRILADAARTTSSRRRRAPA